MNDSALNFACRHCGQLLTAPPAEANQSIACPQCHSQLRVPEAGSDTPAADEYALCDGVDQPASGVTAVHQQYIPVVCTLCETRMYGTLDQVGEQIRCPDCGRKYVVPPAPPEPPTPATPLLAPDYAEGYAVRDEPDEPIAVDETEDDAVPLLCSACGSPLPPGTRTPGDRLFCRLCGGLSEVPAEDAEDEAAGSEKPRSTDWQAPSAIRLLSPGVLYFPFYPGCRSRLIILSVAGTVVLVGLTIAIAAVGSIFGAMFGVCLFAFSALTGLCWCVVTAAMMLAILEDTSEGVDVVESWPNAVWLDWAPTSFFVFNSLALSAVPGFLLTFLPISTTVAWTGIAIGVFLFFPILLLSMKEADSALQLYSRPIARSLRRVWWAWGLFYTATAGVVFAGALLLAIASFFEWFGWLICVAVFLYATMIYFRMLGRLTWFIESESL